MGLCENLWHKGILIEVFNAVYLATELVVLLAHLLNLSHQVLVLQVQSPELLIVVGICIIFRMFRLYSVRCSRMLASMIRFAVQCLLGLDFTVLMHVD